MKKKGAQPAQAAVASAADAKLPMEGWLCPVCIVEIPKESSFCTMCLYSRPMDRRNVPQIFAGFKLHFNGVISRTLKHPSHSVEWRMAERHGAQCMAQFDPTQTNLLIYRPGYERSEKVRKCVEGEHSIPAVPIAWMLDSLLQSRQIHPALYRLTSIPAVAQQTAKGPLLPHHQHPYYLMNMEEYSIPSSFGADRKQQKALEVAKNSMEEGGPGLPPTFVLQELQYTNVDVFRAACNTLNLKGSAQDEDENDGDDRETRKREANIGLLRCEQRHNCVDKLLFSGVRCILTPSLEANPHVKQALKMCGANLILSSGGEITNLLRTSVTHVLYDNSEKKCDLMIEAARAKKEFPGLTMADLKWAEDCLIFGEIIPAYGPYVPTEKLLETLSKKLERR